jgi:hypothetical protein
VNGTMSGAKACIALAAITALTLSALIPRPGRSATPRRRRECEPVQPRWSQSGLPPGYFRQSRRRQILWFRPGAGPRVARGSQLFAIRT